MADDTATQGGQSSSQGASQQASSGSSQQGNTSQGNQQTTQAQAQTQSSSTQQNQAPSRPAYVAENFWDGAAGKVKDKEFGEHLSALEARVAADDVRRLALPKDADAYKIELPKDFKAPDGIEFKFNEADPNLAQARAVMHDIDQGKISGQEAFSKLLGLYAGAQVASKAQIDAARTAEVTKLGANGTARVTAVTTFFKSFLGEAEGAQLASRMFTARDVEIAEKLIQKVSTQGSAPFRSNGREPAAPAGRLSDADYNKLSPAAKLDYARQFDQKQFTNGRAA